MKLLRDSLILLQANVFNVWDEVSCCVYQKIQLIGGRQQTQLQQTVEVGGHQDVRNVSWSFPQPVGDGRGQQRESVHLVEETISAVYKQGRHCSWQSSSVLIFIKLPIAHDWVSGPNKAGNSAAEIICSRCFTAESCSWGPIYSSSLYKSSQCIKARKGKTAGVLGVKERSLRQLADKMKKGKSH